MERARNDGGGRNAALNLKVVGALPSIKPFPQNMACFAGTIDIFTTLF
jgi:hypothetical protein